MLQHLYICRHGFRANFDDMTFDVGPSGLAGDPALTPHGVYQAEELASFLSDPGRVEPYPVPTKIYSSAFYRCIETAQPLAVALKRNHSQAGGIALENGVGEWIRLITDVTKSASRPGPAEALRGHFSPGLLDEEYQAVLYPSSRGETEAELTARVEEFLGLWIPKVDKAGHSSVVIVAHAAVVILLGRILTKQPELYIPAGCASTSLYRRRGADEGWEPIWLGRSDYLSKGSERDWQFGMPE